MPLTAKGKKIKKAMRATYKSKGKKEADRIFWKSKQKGTIKGVD